MIINPVSIKAKFIGLGARAIEKGRGYGVRARLF